MIYGYARVSSVGQAREGNSLEVQTEALKNAGAQNVFFDVYTGKKMNRPKFDQLMSELKRGDTLMVTKLDRFARSAWAGSQTIEELMERGVTVHILNMGVLDNSITGKLIRTILLAFAEYEKDSISERMNEGKYYKKQTDPNYREGRRRVEIPDFEKYLQKQKDGQMTVRECCAALGIGRRTWYNRVAELAT